MNPWKQLLDVQALDTVHTQLDHRRSRLPERAELAEVEDALAARRADQERAEGERHALQREQKRLEDEISLIEDKIKIANDRLYAGGSSDVKELQALQDEIAGWKSRIGALEDDELEIMEQVEPIDARLAELASDRASLDERAVALTKVIAEAEAAIDAEEASVLERREAMVAVIDGAALTAYDKARSQLGGVAVARLEGGVCGACHMKLSAMENDRILHLAPDDEVRCEDCGRFLVRD